MILFEKMGIPGGRKTKTGYSTAADILEKLAPEQPIVNDILEYRQLTKLKSTYADGLSAVLKRMAEFILLLIRRLQRPGVSAAQNRTCRIFQCVWSLDV